MPLYDRPLWQLIRDCLQGMGDHFTAQEMIACVKQEYPGFDDKSLRRCLRFMSANDGATMSTVPKELFKIDRSTYRRYDPERDGVYDGLGRAIGADDEGDPGNSEEPTEEALEFALELHLEEFMAKYWGRIDFGRSLKLYEGVDGRNGRQFATGIGNIDFLCQDTACGDLVVVELKKGRSSDRVLGQCQRYMGWVQENLAQPGQTVRGIIIAPDQDDRLRFALKVATSVEMLCYRLDFELLPPAERNAK